MVPSVRGVPRTDLQHAKMTRTETCPLASRRLSSVIRSDEVIVAVRAHLATTIDTMETSLSLRKGVSCAAEAAAQYHLLAPELGAAAEAEVEAVEEAAAEIEAEAVDEAVVVVEAEAADEAAVVVEVVAADEATVEAGGHQDACIIVDHVMTAARDTLMSPTHRSTSLASRGKQEVRSSKTSSQKMALKSSKCS